MVDTPLTQFIREPTAQVLNMFNSYAGYVGYAVNVVHTWLIRSGYTVVTQWLRGCYAVDTPDTPMP